MLHRQARPACLHSCVCVPSDRRKSNARSWDQTPPLPAAPEACREVESGPWRQGMCQERSLLNFSVLLTDWIQQACLIWGTLACVPEGRTRLSPSLPSASQEVSVGATQVSLVWLLLYFQSGGPAACHTQCLVKATCPVWGCRSVGLGCTQPPFPKSSEGPSQCPCSRVAPRCRPGPLQGWGLEVDNRHHRCSSASLAQGWGQEGAGRKKDIAMGQHRLKEFIEKRAQWT